MKINEIAYEARDTFKPNQENDFRFIGLEHVEAQNLRVSGYGSSRNVQSNKYFFKQGDILFGTLRPYFKKLIIAPFDGVCSTEFSVIRAKNERDLEFVFYLMSQNKFIDFATVNSNGARPRTKWKLFSEFEFDDLGENSRPIIGQKVHVYDRLISNDIRRIALLEESARLLYREWFVHLRFPGHDTTKIVNGVPEGWSLETVNKLAGVKSGYAFKSKDWRESGHPVIKIKNIMSNGAVSSESCQFVEDEIAEKAKKFAIPNGGLLIAMTGATVGKVGIMPDTKETYFLNQRVGLFFSKYARDITSFLYAFFQSDFAQTSVDNLAGGAAQPNISAKQIESIPLLIPKDDIMELYLNICDPFLQQRRLLQSKINELTQARDILLPRLMDGRIEL